MKADRTPSYTFIPAQPGWYVLDTVLTEDLSSVESFVREPVIAWRIELEATDSRHNPFISTCPITTQGPFTDDYFLQRPDGSMFWPECEDFPNEELALKRATELLKRGHKPIKKAV